MDRVAKLALLVGFLCVLLLAAVLAVDGYYHGAGANHQHPPGIDGAFLNVMIGVFFLGPIVWAVGAAGGLGARLVGEGIKCWRKRRSESPGSGRPRPATMLEPRQAEACPGRPAEHGDQAGDRRPPGW